MLFEKTEKDLQETEKELFFYFIGHSGSFMTALFDAILRADIQNKERLRMGFPQEVHVVERYKNEPGYWESVVKRLNGG